MQLTHLNSFMQMWPLKRLTERVPSCWRNVLLPDVTCLNGHPSAHLLICPSGPAVHLSVWTLTRPSPLWSPDCTPCFFIPGGSAQFCLYSLSSAAAPPAVHYFILRDFLYIPIGLLLASRQSTIGTLL